MTVAALIALRDAGGLDVQCHYVVTDWVQGTTLAGPNLVELHATAPNVLALEAKVFTPYDNEAWAGMFDIDRGAVGQMIELRDNLNNTVKDSSGTSPIVGTFPWGTATWLENEFDSVTLTNAATARSVTNCRVANSTVNMAGWTAGSWANCKIEAASNITTGPTMTLNGSQLSGATLTNNGTGGITVQSNSGVYQSLLINDLGSVKNIVINDSDLRGVQLRTQAGTVAKNLSVGASRLRGRPGGDSITHLGDVSVTFANADVSFNSTWTLDGPDGPSVNIRDCTIDGIQINRSATAGRLDITSGHFTSTVFDHQGSGQIFATQAVQTKGGTLRLTAASTGDLTFQRSTLEDATVQVTGVRSLSVIFGSYVGGQATVTESSTTPTVVPSIGDRIDQSRITGPATVTFSTTSGGANVNELARSVVRGSSVAGEGVVTITGTTDGAFIDNCEILGGIVTINNAGSGLNGASAFTGNHVDGGSTISYTGGDNTAKQVRNNRVEGLSTVTLTNLTGSAGAGLADVFGVSVRGQSTMTVAGARVAGQPVRDCTIEQGSALTVPAGGSMQRCRVAGGATVDGGAFTHFDTEISLAAVKTLTAANVNRLANKSFDDTI